MLFSAGEAPQRRSDASIGARLVFVRAPALCRAAGGEWKVAARRVSRIPRAPGFAARTSRLILVRAAKSNHGPKRRKYKTKQKIKKKIFSRHCQRDGFIPIDSVRF